MELNKSEYALLNAVALDRWHICLLSAENMHDIINRHHHGLSVDELISCFLRLCQDGLIECTLEEEPPVGEAHLNPDKELLRLQLDHSGVWPPPAEQIVFYGVTNMRGALWEKMTVLDWSKFIRRIYVRVNDNPMFLISGGDYNLVKLEMELCRISGSRDIMVPGTDTWKTVCPWRPTYWKTLPTGYEVRFRYIRDSGPYVEYNRYRRMLDEALALQRWCKSFQEVCDEYFKNG